MEVHFVPDLQAKIDRWVMETGRGPDELVEDAMAGYFDELARTPEMLNSRYDDLKSGRVKPIDGEEFFENLSSARGRIAQEAFASMTVEQGFHLHPKGASSWRWIARL
jgi:hypothetical protein